MADVEILLDAVKILRPKLVELGTFDAWIQINRGLISDAIQTLNYIVSVCGHFTYAKAVLAYCLFLQKDAGWHALAAEVLARNEPAVAVRLIQVMQDFDDFHHDRLSTEKRAALDNEVKGYADGREKQVSANDASQQPGELDWDAQSEQHPLRA